MTARESWTTPVTSTRIGIAHDVLHRDVAQDLAQPHVNRPADFVVGGGRRASEPVMLARASAPPVTSLACCRSEETCVGAGTLDGSAIPGGGISKRRRP